MAATAKKRRKKQPSCGTLRRRAKKVKNPRKRRQAREQRHGTMDASHRGNGDGSLHGDPLAGLDLAELKGVMEEALNQLPPKYRLPLILHYFGGLSRDEIARELNCKPATVTRGSAAFLRACRKRMPGWPTPLARAVRM